jgi:molybdopterin biosynthesis enzyme
MQIVLIVVTLALATAIVAAIVGYALRPSRASKSDAMQQVVGDAPRGVRPDTPWPRGGYAAMDEKAPIQAKRPS